MNNLYAFFVALSLLCSCSNKVYNSDTCDDLSMKSFKGFPKEANEFKTNCKDIEIFYTHELCQQALQKLVMGEPISKLKKDFGEKIDGCFSENDLKKFLSEEKMITPDQSERERLPADSEEQSADTSN